MILERRHALRRWLQRTRARRGAVILLYHRVAEPGLDPWGLTVSPKHFEEHLEVLGRRGRSPTLSALVESLQSDQPQNGATAITFDDGYADNLHMAMPLLERHDQRATVFLTTGPIIRQRAFWWDELAQILFCRAILPRELELSLPSETFTWTLEEQASREAPGIARWRAWQPVTQRQGRQPLYLALWQRLQKVPHSIREEALEGLRHWAGGEAVPQRSDRPLTVQEVAALANGHTIEVGAHTVNHPALASVGVEEQHDEIARSKTDVEAMVGTIVQGFSYPHGSYARATVDAVRAAGFAYACNSAPTALTSATSPFTLPRIPVPDCDGDSLARELMA